MSKEERRKRTRSSFLSSSSSPACSLVRPHPPFAGRLSSFFFIATIKLFQTSPLFSISHLPTHLHLSSCRFSSRFCPGRVLTCSVVVLRALEKCEKSANESEQAVKMTQMKKKKKPSQLRRHRRRFLSKKPFGLCHFGRASVNLKAFSSL